jgi:hypothetical protein
MHPFLKLSKPSSVVGTVDRRDGMSNGEGDEPLTLDFMGKGAAREYAFFSATGLLLVARRVFLRWCG